MKRALIALFLLTLFAPFASAEDNIPDNCENTCGSHYNPNLFATYEAHNRRLLIRDWATGADVLILGTDLAETLVRSWSPSCRYLLTAEVNADTYTTVVWDTVNGGRVGQVADAQGIPHPTTWGANDALIVETRNGGILWNVPNNTQVTLTTVFDPITVRNFTRLRWDAANNQLIANIVDGNRKVFDMVSGQEVAVAINTSKPVPSEFPTVLIGGRYYSCDPYRPYSRIESRPSLDFDPDQQRITIFLQSRGESFVNGIGGRREWFNPRETIAVLEENVQALRLIRVEWTPDCQYVLGYLERSYNVYDTVVWDVANLRRAGTFADARDYTHTVTMSEASNAAVIETRNGAFLWLFETDTRIKLTDVSTINYDGSYWSNNRVRSFLELYWSIDENVFVARTFDDPDNYTKFDGASGQILSVSETYPRHYGASDEYTPFFQVGKAIVGESGFGDDTYRCYDQFIIRYTPEIVRISTNQTITFGSESSTVIYDIRFSLTCRYAIISITDSNLPYDGQSVDTQYGGMMQLWDLETNTLITEVRNYFKRTPIPARVLWSPDEQYVYVRASSGLYVLSIPEQRASLLTFDPNDDYINSDNDIQFGVNVYFDYSRGQLLVGGMSGVYAFSLQTGKELYRFDGSSYYWNVGYDVEGDTIIASDSGYNGSGNQLVYNLNTGELLEGGEE